MSKKILIALTLLLIVLPFQTSAAEKRKNSSDIKIPDYVMNISKENTYPNPTQNLPRLQPSDLTTQLLNTVKVNIENPTLIRMLNESTINTSKATVGYRATIFLGEWPLDYESEETNVNWEFKQVNVNKIDNRGGKSVQKLSYRQQKEQKVTGGLTAKIPNSDEIQKMMILQASEKTDLPLSFQTVIGKGTQKEQVYNIDPKKVGYLTSHVPAVNEKGKVTFGEVYLVLTGSKMKLEVKNLTQQGIGAWIPIQDHLSFKFNTSDQPK